MAKAKKKPEDDQNKEPTRGRPTKFKPEYIVQVKILAEKGFTDKEVAQIFGVAEQTINNWKKDFPLFFESLTAGKEVADQKVVQALYERALGYSHPEVHITSFQGDVTKTDVIKHYPPDTAACFIWLKNRSGWKDKIDHDLTSDGKPIAPVIVVFGEKPKDDPEQTVH